MTTQQSISDLLNSKTAWGSQEVKSLPFGIDINNEMKKMNKTSLSTKDITYILFGIKCKDLGFIYYNEFVELMKLQKTMISKPVAQDLLRTFWSNTNEDYKSNPELFNTIKSVIITLNNGLVNSNSTQRLRLAFMQEFLNLTVSV